MISQPVKSCTCMGCCIAHLIICVLDYPNTPSPTLIQIINVSLYTFLRVHVCVRVDGCVHLCAHVCMGVCVRACARMCVCVVCVCNWQISPIIKYNWEPILAILSCYQPCTNKYGNKCSCLVYKIVYPSSVLIALCMKLEMRYVHVYACENNTM